MPPPWDLLVGPVGALVIAVLALWVLGRVIQVLWKSHLEDDAEDKRQRDESQLLLRDAIDGIKRLASAWEERNRREARAPKKPSL